MATDKPGWQTSEYWQTIMNFIVGVGVIVKVIDAGQSSNLIQAVVQVIMGVIGLGMTVGPSITYIMSRTWLKKKDATPNA